MATTNEKTGVMFYLDTRPCLRRLTLEEKGKLFEAILDYGEFGLIPELDGMLGVAWDVLQSKLDQDSKRYARQVLQKQYGAYSRECRKADSVPVSYDLWVTLSDDDRCRLMSPDEFRYRTTTASATPTATADTTANTITNTSTNTQDAEPAEPSVPASARQSFGTYGWVKLTREGYDRLVSDLGEEETRRCIAYVDESAQATGNKNKWRD